MRAGALQLLGAVSLLLVAGAPSRPGAAIRAGLGRQSFDQRAKIAVGSSRPRASSRTAMSPHSTVPPRSAKRLAQQFPDRQRRHPHRIDGEHEEAAVGVEQRRQSAIRPGRPSSSRQISPSGPRPNLGGSRMMPS